MSQHNINTTTTLAMSPSGLPSRPLLPRPDAGRAGPPVPAAPRRRCISSACLQCRKRKSKCDGKRPVCHACISVYGSSCMYDLDSDRRRKGALKRDIHNLTEQNDGLRSILGAFKVVSDLQINDLVSRLRSNPGDNYDAIVDAVDLMKQAAAATNSMGLDGVARPASTPFQPAFNSVPRPPMMGGSNPGPSTFRMDQPTQWPRVNNDVSLMGNYLHIESMTAMLGSDAGGMPWAPYKDDDAFLGDGPDFSNDPES